MPWLESYLARLYVSGFRVLRGGGWFSVLAALVLAQWPESRRADPARCHRCCGVRQQWCHVQGVVIDPALLVRSAVRVLFVLALAAAACPWWPATAPARGWLIVAG